MTKPTYPGFIKYAINYIRTLYNILIVIFQVFYSQFH